MIYFTFHSIEYLNIACMHAWTVYGRVKEFPDFFLLQSHISCTENANFYCYFLDSWLWKLRYESICQPFHCFLLILVETCGGSVGVFEYYSYKLQFCFAVLKHCLCIVSLFCNLSFTPVLKSCHTNNLKVANHCQTPVSCWLKQGRGLSFIIFIVGLQLTGHRVLLTATGHRKKFGWASALWDSFLLQQ